MKKFGITIICLILFGSQVHADEPEAVVRPWSIQVTFDQVIQIVTAGAAIGAVFVSWKTSRKVEIVHLATNSMKDELVALTAKSSRAAGILEGRHEKEQEQEQSESTSSKAPEPLE